MADYLWRERRRRHRKVVGILIVLMAAALVLTWPGGLRRINSAHLLAGLRPVTTQAAVGQPMVEEPTRSDKPADRPMALHPILPPMPATTRPASRDLATSRPALILPDASLRPRVATRPAPPKVDAAGQVLATVISPVTQPAVDLPDGPKGAARLLQEGLDLRKNDQLVEARDKLNTALHNGVTVPDAATAREALADIANRTIFNKVVLKNDPLVRWYTIISGDKLGRIARKAGVSEILLAQINTLRKPSFLTEGSKLKIVQGPFHAAICKHTHEMHLYLQHVYVGTLRVALGQDGSTPTGLWRVVNHQTNPAWKDPRTGKFYHPDDPANPLGRFWIGMEGLDGEAAGQPGYGIHGTIEPQTVGQDVSMGCIRLAADDIALVYRLLEPGLSYVVIYP